MMENFPLLSPEDVEWLLEKYSKDVLKHKTLEEILSLLPDPDCYLDHIIVSPVIEVTSISVRNDKDANDKMYDIYGAIQLIDWEGATFDLYNRKRDNPETISNNVGFLTITPPMDRAITATGLAKVHFDLYDANKGGAPFMNISFHWDSMMKDGYDEVHDHTRLFDDVGEGGSAVIGFITYRHASVCNVDVKFLMDCADIDVYGEIIARAGKFSTILFDKKQNESVNVKYGTNIPLSRHVVVLPASSLAFNIHVKLFNGVTHEKIVEESTRVGIFGTIGPDISRGLCDIIELQVQWTHPYLQPHLLSNVAPEISMFNLCLRKNPLGCKPVEIYSVSIAGHMAEDMDIWGSIEFNPLGGDRISLFKENKSSPRKLLPYQIVPLKSYTDCLCVAFSLKLVLRDGNGRLICEGWLNWNELTSVKRSELLNRHLCSVVRSSTGHYAVIHHSIFLTGIRALVRIYLNGKRSDIKYLNADGSVCAQYCDYDYSTLYQYEYFRKKLFVGKSTDPWLPYPCSSLLLSESSVIVPEGSALMVDVNLKLNYSTTHASICDDGNMSEGSLQPRDSFEEVLEFEYENDDIDLTSKNAVFQKEIEGSSVQIVIQVEWRSIGLI